MLLDYRSSISKSYNDLKILKLQSLNELEVAKFMYRVNNKTAPTSLLNIFDHTSHDHGTRHKDDPQYSERRNFQDMRNSFICKGPELWSHLPLDTRNSKNLISFSSKMKKKLSTA